jgi:hypothetical protein
MSHELENDLLLCIARHQLSHDLRERLSELLNQTMDWNYLIKTAEHHGLAPLLHKHLSSLPETSNKSYSRAIEDDALRNTQESLYLTGQLVRLNRKFGSAGVRVLAFKGPLLSQLVYGDVSLRRAGDLDLLIERHDYKRAKELLESMGYKMTPELSGAQEASHLKTHCEIQFVRDQGFSVVDLHWELAPKTFTFNLSAADVIRNSQSIEFSGETFETFSNEDLVFYQCMHAAKHLWMRFEWICAIAELLRREDFVDWDKLVDRATNTDGERMLALGLRLVQRFYEAQVPQSVFDRVDADGRMLIMANELTPAIFRVRVTRVESIETGLYNFRIMDRKRDAWLSLIRAIILPTLADWQSLNLPSGLHSLYYVYRPLRLMKVYVSTFRERLRTDRVGRPNSQVIHSDGA